MNFLNNQNLLTSHPGEPYTPPNAQCDSCVHDGAAEQILTDIKGNFLIVPGFVSDGVNVYAIDHATGSLSLVSGSPFINRVVHGGGDLGPGVEGATMDPTRRLARAGLRRNPVRRC